MTQSNLTPLPHRNDELHQLIATLPVPYQEALQDLPGDTLLEIIIDLGRKPQARYPDQVVDLADQAVTHEDLQYVLRQVGRFSADNRAGIERTLHRISALRNRQGDIVGLTLRVGRAVFGTINAIRDLVESGVSILLLGRPGVGKTTKLREIARVLADDLQRRVMIVDTSNEIAGDADIPHAAIGSARRIQVAHPDRQHAVMIEAVENHMPEVIIVDEIGTAAEAAAARTIAERGVTLIGTAHGNTLENVVNNPTLSDLVGGVQTVTLSDEEARLRGTQKTISERKAAPTFGAVVEIVNRDELILHADTAAAVDALLRGQAPGGERRVQHPDGQVESEVLPASSASAALGPAVRPAEANGMVRIYPYGVSRDSVDRVIRDLGLNARTVGRPEQAGMILALNSRADDVRLNRIVNATHLPLHLVKKDTTAQLKRVLQEQFAVFSGIDEREIREALQEAEAAIERVLNGDMEVALSPRRASLRRLQHKLVTRHKLFAESSGSEPQRHLTVYAPAVED